MQQHAELHAPHQAHGLGEGRDSGPASAPAECCRTAICTGAWQRRAAPPPAPLPFVLLLVCAPRVRLSRAALRRDAFQAEQFLDSCNGICAWCWQLGRRVIHLPHITACMTM